MRNTIGLVVGVVLVLAGCQQGNEEPCDDDTSNGDDDAEDDDDVEDDDTTGTEPPTCGFDVPAAVSIEVKEEYGPYPPNPEEFTWNSTIWATVCERAPARFHKVALQLGSCRYLELTYGNCGEPCDPGELCSVDDICEPVYLVTVPGGVLTITGLGDPLLIEPSYQGFYSQELLVDIDIGDTVTASLSGDVFPPVPPLVAQGVATLASDVAATHVALVDGEDTEITWEPGPDPDTCMNVTIYGINAGHGLPINDIIECVGTDTGSMVIPHVLIEAFPEGRYPTYFGIGCNAIDCPPSTLSRFTRTSIDLPEGPVELVIRNTVYFGWEHWEGR